MGIIDDTPCRFEIVTADSFLENTPAFSAALTHDPAESEPIAGSPRSDQRGGQIAGGWRQVRAGSSGGVGAVKRVSIGGRSSVLIPGRASPGTERPARGVVPGAVRDRSLELQQKGFGEKHAHPRGIEPGRGAGIADEGDGPAHAELVKQIAQLSRAARQGIEDMRPPHQEGVSGLG